ncbi:uncharacterized protein LOC128883549 [Hylaeus volcanicus]|uniref:uncharacterized protein LOC128883549 n=1 Tax=Hylaeus volcanicus TaxID=313075 RepID=UPI0023B7A59E|nr:uncharacterized protein LOC128883549 [Hylaeus volcanicus]
MLPLIYSRDRSMNPMPYNTIACETEYCVRQNIRSVREEFGNTRRLKIPYPCEIDPIQAYKDLLAQQKDMGTTCQNFNNIVTVKDEKLSVPSHAPFTCESKTNLTDNLSQHGNFATYETPVRQNRQLLTNDSNSTYDNVKVLRYPVRSTKNNTSVYVAEPNKNNAAVNGINFSKTRVPSINESHYAEENPSYSTYLNRAPYDNDGVESYLKHINQTPVQMETQYHNKGIVNNIDYKCLSPLERESILYKIHSPMQREYLGNSGVYPVKEYSSVFEANPRSRPVVKRDEQSQMHENLIKQNNGKKVTIIEKPTHVFHFNPQKSSCEDNMDVECEQASQAFNTDKENVTSPGVFENIATFARVLVDVTKTKVIKAFGPSEQNISGVTHSEKSYKGLKSNSNKLRVYSKYPYGKTSRASNLSSINSNCTSEVRKSCLKNRKPESQQTQISNKFYDTKGENQDTQASYNEYYANCNQQNSEYNAYTPPAPLHCRNQPKQPYMSVNENFTNSINNSNTNQSKLDYNLSSLEENVVQFFSSDESLKFERREASIFHSPSRSNKNETHYNNIPRKIAYETVSIPTTQYSLLHETNPSQGFASNEKNKPKFYDVLYNKINDQGTTNQPQENYDVIEDKPLLHNGFRVSNKNPKQDQTHFTELINPNADSLHYLLSSKKLTEKEKNITLCRDSSGLDQTTLKTDFTLPKSPSKSCDVTKTLMPTIDPGLQVFLNDKMDLIQKTTFAATPKLKPTDNVSHSNNRMLKRSPEMKSQLKHRNNDSKSSRTKAEHIFYKHSSSTIKIPDVNKKVHSVPKRHTLNTSKPSDIIKLTDSSTGIKKTMAVHPFSQGSKNASPNKAQRTKNAMCVSNSTNKINSKRMSPAHESHELTKGNVSSTSTIICFNESKKSNSTYFQANSKVSLNNSSKIKNNGNIDNVNSVVSVHVGLDQDSIKRHCSTTSLQKHDNASTCKKTLNVCNDNYTDLTTSTKPQGIAKFDTDTKDMHKDLKNDYSNDRKTVNRSIDSDGIRGSHSKKTAPPLRNCTNSYPTTFSSSTMTQSSGQPTISNKNKESFNGSLTKLLPKSNSFNATRSPILKKKSTNKNLIQTVDSIPLKTSVEDDCLLCKNPAFAEVGSINENSFSPKNTTPKKLLPYIACSPNNNCTRNSPTHIRKQDKLNDTSRAADLTWNHFQSEKAMTTPSSSPQQLQRACLKKQNNAGEEFNNHSTQNKKENPLVFETNLDNINRTVPVLTPSSLSMTRQSLLINRQQTSPQHDQWVDSDDVISHENNVSWYDEKLNDYKKFSNGTEGKSLKKSPSSTQGTLVTFKETPEDHTVNFSYAPSPFSNDILTRDREEEFRLGTSQGTGLDHQIPSTICIYGSMLSPHDKLPPKTSFLSRDERINNFLLNVKQVVEEAKELKMPEVADLLEQLDVAVTTLKTKTYVHDASEYAKYALNAIQQVKKPLNSFSSSESMTCTTLPSDTWMYTDQNQSFHPVAGLRGKKTPLQRFLETGELQLKSPQINTTPNSINKTNPFTSSIPPLINSNFFFETGKEIVPNRKKDRSFIQPIVSTSICQFFLDKFAKESIPLDNVKLLSKTLEAVPIQLVLKESRFPYAVIQDTPVAMICLGVFESQIVALQVPKIKDPETSQIDLLYKFLHEWDILRHCDHPYLLKFLGGIRVSPEQVWLVMDRFEGIDYRTIQLSKNNQFTLRQRVTMCFQLASVLEYLHTPDSRTGKKIVVHRNISPENILVNSEDMSIRLCGFTYARESSTDEVECIDDASWLYAAPEFLYRTALDTDTIELPDIPQWVTNMFAEQPITSKLDIWSAGCVFQEILCGPNPLKHITGEEALSSRIFLRLSIALTSETFIPQIYSHVPFQCQELIASCLQMDPRKRPSASMVVQRWKNILSSLVDHQ